MGCRISEPSTVCPKLQKRILPRKLTYPLKSSAWKTILSFWNDPFLRAHSFQETPIPSIKQILHPPISVVGWLPRYIAGSKHKSMTSSFFDKRPFPTAKESLWLYVPRSKLLILGMVIPPFIGNPYNGYINPYYWVDDHPLLYGNNGSLDPGTYEIDTPLCNVKSRCIISRQKTCFDKGHPSCCVGFIKDMQVGIQKN